MPDDHAPFVWSEIDDYGFTPEEFRVLHRIARRGKCTESFVSMAKAIKMSESIVRRSVRILLSAGVISKEDRKGDTSIIRVQPICDWMPPDSIDDLRPKEKGRPPRKKADPVTADTTVTDTVLCPIPEVLSPIQDTPVTVTGGPVTDTDKGIPLGSTSKEVPKEIPLSDFSEGELPPGVKRPMHPYFEIFREAFETFYGTPCPRHRSGFIQFAELNKLHGGKLDPMEWLKAVTNYFASELTNRTFADLSAHYAEYHKNAVDRFKKPIVAEKPNGRDPTIPKGYMRLDDGTICKRPAV